VAPVTRLLRLVAVTDCRHVALGGHVMYFTPMHHTLTLEEKPSIDINIAF